MTIRAVALDAVGTLLHPDPPALSVYADVGRTFGSHLSIECLHDRFRMAFGHEDALDRQADWRTSEARERERWQRIVAYTLHDVRDPEACFHCLWQHFARPGSWRLDEHLTPLLQHFTQAGYSLYLASNFDQRLHSVCAGFPELACVGQIVVSSQLGWRKPSKKFFEALCQQMGLAASEVLFIGDDLENDVRGAAAAGLRGLLWESRRGTKDHKDSRDRKEIAGLTAPLHD